MLHSISHCQRLYHLFAGPVCLLRQMKQIGLLVMKYVPSFYTVLAWSSREIQMHFIKLPNGGKYFLNFKNKYLGFLTMAFIQ